MQNIIIKPAQKSDLNDIYNLESRLFGEHGYPAFFIRQAYDCWPDGLLVAKCLDVDSNEHLVGYVLLAPHFSLAKMANNEMWILALAVDEAMQGKGCGKALLNYALMISANYDRVFLTVHPDNHARFLYQNFGFSVVGIEEDYFGPGDPRLKMLFENIYPSNFKTL